VRTNHLFNLVLKDLRACLNEEGKFTEAVDVLREAVSIKQSVNDSPELKERCESQLSS
jgi:hypothetical protein